MLEVARLVNLPQNVLNGNGGHLSQRQLGGQRVQRRVVVGQVVKGLVKNKKFKYKTLEHLNNPLPVTS